MNGMVCIVLAATEFLLMVGCQTMPSDTRTGRVRDLVIRGSLDPVDLRVNIGDEIRWTNMTSASIRIVLPTSISDKISCRRNFSGWLSGGTETTLDPDESASLCFGGSTYSTYLVRQTGGRGGEMNVTGAIHVDQPSEQPSAEEMPNTMDDFTQPGWMKRHP